MSHWDDFFPRGLDINSINLLPFKSIYYKSPALRRHYPFVKSLLDIFLGYKLCLHNHYQYSYTYSRDNLLSSHYADGAMHLHTPVTDVLPLSPPTSSLPPRP